MKLSSLLSYEYKIGLHWVSNWRNPIKFFMDAKKLWIRCRMTKLFHVCHQCNKKSSEFDVELTKTTLFFCQCGKGLNSVSTWRSPIFFSWMQKRTEFGVDLTKPIHFFMVAKKVWVRCRSDKANLFSLSSMRTGLILVSNWRNPVRFFLTMTGLDRQPCSIHNWGFSDSQHRNKAGGATTNGSRADAMVANIDIAKVYWWRVTGSQQKPYQGFHPPTSGTKILPQKLLNTQSSMYTR